MMPNQREGGVVVIEGYIAPGAGVMARAAGCAELSAVGILGGMTRVTIGWSAFVDTVGVTSLTLNTCMFPGQREGGVVVVERHICPFGGFMAGTTACAELSIVGVLGGMTRVTVLGCPFENTIRMT